MAAIGLYFARSSRIKALLNRVMYETLTLQRVTAKKMLDLVSSVVTRGGVLHCERLSDKARNKVVVIRRVRTFKIVVPTLIVSLSFLPVVSASPSWILTGAYVKYDQMFSWSAGSQTEQMTWNITSLSGSIADLQIASYSYNVTNGQVNFFPAGDAWKVNTDNRNITESSTGVTGLKSPFWIESNAGLGSTVDAYFGTTASIQQSETIGVLGRNIDCWKVSMSMGPQIMQRWYDPATGIVLRIDSSITRGGVSMNVRESAVASNIGIIGTGSTGGGWLSLWPYMAALAVVAVVVVAGALGYLRRRH